MTRQRCPKMASPRPDCGQWRGRGGRSKRRRRQHGLAPAERIHGDQIRPAARKRTAWHRSRRKSPRNGSILAIRPRRNRRAEWTRRLVRENVLTTDDLIWPLFLVDGTKVRAPVDSMPDVERLSVDEAVRAAERAAKLTIPCLALFPYTEPGAARRRRLRSAQSRQSGLPRHPRHQERGAGDRRALRRGARSLYQPRP